MNCMWERDVNLVMTSGLVSLKMLGREQRQRTFASIVDVSCPTLPRDLLSFV